MLREALSVSFADICHTSRKRGESSTPNPQNDPHVASGLLYADLTHPPPQCGRQASSTNMLGRRSLTTSSCASPFNDTQTHKGSLTIKMATVTADELAKNNTRDSCWIAIDGTVWDVTKFLPEHPGGANIVMKVAGKDATEQYSTFHGPSLVSET